jgi:hypothetical protein
MSEYDFFGGADGPGGEPVGEPDALLADAAFDGTDHGGPDFGGLLDLDADETGEAGEHGVTADYDSYEEPAEPVESADYGVLDGLDFDFDNVDLTALDDLVFDASYDVIGADPDENGWWSALTSDENHDGAYDVVSYDPDANPYVTQ